MKDELDTIVCMEGTKWLSSQRPESVDCCVTSPPYWSLRYYAMRHHLGLERTPQEYVEKLLDMFDALRRALKPTGTFWLNLGNVYSKTSVGSSNTMPHYSKSTKIRGRTYHAQHLTGAGVRRLDPGVGRKSLVPIAWMMGLGLQRRGWTLRQDIIWFKPRGLPNPEKTKCVAAHEYVLFLSKTPDHYFDADAIRDVTMGTRRALLAGQKNVVPEFRNRRSVWSVPVESTPKGAHTAVFPEKLVEPCILAGCPPGGVVVDPFMGSGTTAVVAKRLGRHYKGCDLNPRFVDLANRRVSTCS